MRRTWYLIAEDNVWFTLDEGQEERWDLFEDRLQHPEEDTPIQVPYPSSEVEQWKLLDRAMRQGGGTVPYESVHRVAKFMSPKLKTVGEVYVSEWLLYCDIPADPQYKDALCAQGRATRAGARPSYLYPDMYRDLDLYFALSMTIDPVYDMVDKTMLSCALSCDWMNIATALAKTWHKKVPHLTYRWTDGGLGRVTAYRHVPWAVVEELIGSRWLYFYSNRRASPEDRVKAAIALSGEDTPHIDVCCLAGISKQWVSTQPSEVAISPDEEDALFIFNQTTNTLDGLSLPTFTPDVEEAEYELFMVGLHTLRSQVRDSALQPMRDACAKLLNGRYSVMCYYRARVSQYFKNTSSGAIKPSIDRAVEELGVPCLRVLLGVVQFYLRACPKNKRAHRFYQVLKHRVEADKWRHPATQHNTSPQEQNTASPPNLQ